MLYHDPVAMPYCSVHKYKLKCQEGLLRKGGRGSEWVVGGLKCRRFKLIGALSNLRPPTCLKM